MGHERAESNAWRTRSLPDCSQLTAAPSKLLGCNDGKPVQAALLTVDLDEQTARKFFATCHVMVGTVIGSIVTVRGPRAFVEQAVAAPFVRRAAWACPVYPQ
jgi:hypothetical protein